MINYNLERCKYDFSSDSIDIIVLVYDYSGSMSGEVVAMEKANKAFYNSFSKFEEKGTVAISKARFNSGFDMTPFDTVDKFDVSYYADGGTALYAAIVKAARNAIEYYNELIKRLNVVPKITFLVFSDGGDNESGGSYKEAKKMVTELNSLDATTVFVAFKEAIKNGTGNDLNFSCTKDIKSVQELVDCMGNELSKSCKEQSKSAYSLKSEFFSKADKNSEEDDTQNRAIIEDDFFDV